MLPLCRPTSYSTSAGPRELSGGVRFQTSEHRVARTARTLVMDTEAEKILGEGSVDFATERYDLRLNAKSKRASLLALRGRLRRDRRRLPGADAGCERQRAGPTRRTQVIVGEVVVGAVVTPRPNEFGPTRLAFFVGANSFARAAQGRVARRKPAGMNQRPPERQR